MTAFSRLSTASTVTLLLVLCGAAIADDYPTTAAPITQPVYRCGTRAYSNTQCTGGVQVNGPRVARTFDKSAATPQDRAHQMARAVLPPETREKCAGLESRIRTGEAGLKGRDTPPTEKEEGDLAILRVQYRELRC